MKRSWPRADRNCDVNVFRDFGVGHVFDIPLSLWLTALKDRQDGGRIPLRFRGEKCLLRIHNMRLTSWS